MSGQVVGAGVERLGIEMVVGIATLFVIVTVTVIVKISHSFVVLGAKVCM